MIIKEIGIKNFKSFGNNEQVIKLNTETGELILLMGRNGSGKSSLIENIDYALFGKCRGKKKRWMSNNSLPNRINKELVTRVKFISNNINVEVTRGQNPSLLNLIENGVLYDKAGKVNVNDKIENYVGVDIDTFKSFISMSINDFKNFISLSTEDKKLLLDRLFNLETINILTTILKDIAKSNKETINILTTEIETLNESINSINSSIIRVKEQRKINIDEEIKTIKSDILSKKNDYELLKTKIDRINIKKSEVLRLINEKKSELNVISNDIKNINTKITLYESGKCGECETDLTDPIHIGVLEGYITKKETNIKLKDDVSKQLDIYESKYKEIKEIENKANTKFSEMTFNLRDLKNKLDKIVPKSSSDVKDKDKDKDIKEFMKTVKELDVKKNKSFEDVTNLKDKSILHKELMNVFSEDGVKKSIIKNIIKPINHFIHENISYMNMPFTVELDETFSATIRHFGQEIEHDTLSTGETKKINIALLIAYLKLMRTKNNINVLFLDEVFSSIDIEGIDDILKMIRSFSNDYNINIFIIHHSILSLENFDRVIRINKDIFSEIEEIEF